MKQKTPDFWYPKDKQSRSLRASLLQPFEWIYRLAFKLHQASQKAERVNIPVLCIGNLVAGGTGKTPTAIALINFTRDKGLANNPFFLIRGYGGAERGPLLVDPDAHSAWDVGDEALILAQHAPTIVSADRVAGAELAMRKGADVVIMDDGLQNPGIHKDLKLVVINGEMGFGNAHMMPAGPLREPLEGGIEKADGFLMIGEDKTGALSELPQDKPVLKAHLEKDSDYNIDKTKAYLAFAGLGYPEKYFGFLKNDLGLNVIEEIRFPDHCPYEEADLQELHAKAQKIGAELITTQKDYLRLPSIEGIHVHALPVKMVFETPDALMNVLKKALG